MKKSKLFYLVGILILGVALMATGCKKDDDDPDPPIPADPEFEVTAQKYTFEGVHLMYIFFECQTHGAEIMKVVVDGPGGEEGDFYGLGLHVEQGENVGLDAIWLALPGTWELTISGVIEGGDRDGENFTSEAEMTISK